MFPQYRVMDEEDEEQVEQAQDEEEKYEFVEEHKGEELMVEVDDDIYLQSYMELMRDKPEDQIRRTLVEYKRQNLQQFYGDQENLDTIPEVEVFDDDNED